MEINTSHQLEIHCEEMSESGAEDGEVKQELETHPELLLGLALESSQSLHLQRTWCHSCPAQGTLELGQQGREEKPCRRSAPLQAVKSPGSGYLILPNTQIFENPEFPSMPKPSSQEKLRARAAGARDGQRALGAAGQLLLELFQTWRPL